MAKRRSYLAAIFGKAWKEVSFIEVLSEAIAGFMIAIISLYRGWEDKQGAFEFAAECIGCAFLVPLVAFLLRSLFAAPAELVKESWESKKGEETDPKSIYPSIVAILLAVCSILTIGLGFSLRFIFEGIGEKPQITQAPQKELPKPLPDKIIPTPVISNASSVVSPPQVPNAVALMQFETNNPSADSNDLKSELDQLKLQRQAEIAASDQKNNSENQSAWDKNLPLFRHSLESLHDILNQEAIDRGDRIEITSGYIACLPQKIDFKMEETKVAEIRLEKETNVDFAVSITRGQMIAGTTIQPNGIKITSGCGFLEFQPFWVMTGPGFHTIIQIPGYNGDKTTENMNIDQIRELVRKRVKILVAAQIDSLSATNK
jgi:hypothetical protein